MPPPTNFFQFNTESKPLRTAQDIAGVSSIGTNIEKFPIHLGDKDLTYKETQGATSAAYANIPFVVFAPYKRRTRSGASYNINPSEVLENLPDPSFAIALPLPSSGLKTDYTVTYDTPSFSGTTGNIITGVGEAIENIRESGTVLNSKNAETLRQTIINELPLAAKGVAEAFLKGGGTALSLGAGITVNPFVEMMFKEVPFRIHNFNYTFIPRNLDESKRLDRIAQYFKFYMLPSFSLAGTEISDIDNLNQNSTYLSFPYEWQIIQSVQDTTFRLLPSVLQKFNVDYSGGLDSPAFFLDRKTNKRYPTKVTFSLEFREVIQLTRDRIELEKNELIPTQETQLGYTRYRF